MTLLQIVLIVVVAFLSLTIAILYIMVRDLERSQAMAFQYIAQVKQKYGIIERECYNKPKSEDAKQPQCPPDKEAAIVEALKFYGLIAP